MGLDFSPGGGQAGAQQVPRPLGRPREIVTDRIDPLDLPDWKIRQVTGTCRLK